jgi:ComF family protein
MAAGAPPGGPPGKVVEGRVVARFLERPLRVMRTITDDFITTVFPADCRTCGEPLLRAGLSPVCADCFSGIAPQSATLCKCCGEALDMDGVRFAGQYPSEGILCSPCRMVPPEFARAVAYGVYEDELREMIHLLKYERMSAIARPLGEMLARSIDTLRGAAAAELLVVAVPLFPGKQRERGYNQAALLADAALVHLKRSAPEWKLLSAHEMLLRKRDTESQFNLSPKGRRRNLQGAFAVLTDAKIIGREVLLIDDIYTSGATARECARVLRRAGATRVWIATLARAQREMVGRWDAG